MPREKMQTTICGACGLPSAPGTDPGLMVSQLKTPSLSVAERPKPGNLAFRRRLLAARLGVAPLRGGLPDFDHGVVDRQAVAVEHAALDVDFLTGGVRRNQVGADRFLPVVDRAWFPVAAVVRRQTIGEERADRL